MMQVCIEEMPAFSPIKLEITFEREEELAEFYAIFNFVPVSNSLTFINSNEICKSLGTEAYLKVGSGFYQRLQSAMSNV